MTVGHRVVHAARLAAALVAGISATALAPPAGARTVSCGERITASTRVSNDLSCPSDALVVGRDGITIDLRGHRLTAAAQTGTGVDFADHDRVTLRNGTLDGFFTQVQLGRARGSVTSARVVGMRFADGSFGTDGYADRSVIDGNVSADTRAPLALFGGDLQITGDRNSVVGNRARANLMAVVGDRNTVAGNVVSNLNAASGPRGGTVVTRNVAQTLTAFGGAPGATSPSIVLRRNRSVSRSPDQPFGQGGIILIDANHVLVADNAVVVRSSLGERPNTGIEVILLQGGASIGNVITGNLVQGALDDGIFVQGPQTIFFPGRPPLTLPGATGTVLRGNVAVHNGHEVSSGFSQDGIHNASPTSTLTRNVANRNRNLGIESVAGATDGGGNRARENGNPLQCTGVSCRP